MTTYTLECADGRVTDIAAEDDTAAELAALARFGEDAVAADQWDADGATEDGEPCERLLIWGCEADATDDAGARAVASLCVVRIGGAA